MVAKGDSEEEDLLSVTLCGASAEDRGSTVGGLLNCGMDVATEPKRMKLSSKRN